MGIERRGRNQGPEARSWLKSLFTGHGFGIPQIVPDGYSDQGEFLRGLEDQDLRPDTIGALRLELQKQLARVYAKEANVRGRDGSPVLYDARFDAEKKAIHDRINKLSKAFDLGYLYVGKQYINLSTVSSPTPDLAEKIRKKLKVREDDILEMSISAFDSGTWIIISARSDIKRGEKFFVIEEEDEYYEELCAICRKAIRERKIIRPV